MQVIKIVFVLILSGFIYASCKDDNISSSSPDWGVWSSENNTGLTYPSLLTTFNGNLTAGTNSQLIENLQIYGMLIIRADNVTVRNCRIYWAYLKIFYSPFIFLIRFFGCSSHYNGNTTAGSDPCCSGFYHKD